MKYHIHLLLNWSLLYHSPLISTPTGNDFGYYLRFDWLIIVSGPIDISSYQRLTFVESAVICSYMYALRLDIGLYFVLDCCVIHTLYFRIFQHKRNHNKEQQLTRGVKHRGRVYWKGSGTCRNPQWMTIFAKRGRDVRFDFHCTRYIYPLKLHLVCFFCPFPKNYCYYYYMIFHLFYDYLNNHCYVTLILPHRSIFSTK